MRPRECGHVMLILLLTMALMAIFVGIIVPSITFEIKRDREGAQIWSTPAYVVGTESGTNLRAFKGHMRGTTNWVSGMSLATIHCCAVSADGTRGLTGGDDGRVEVWSLG